MHNTSSTGETIRRYLSSLQILVPTSQLSHFAFLKHDILPHLSPNNIVTPNSLSKNSGADRVLLWAKEFGIEISDDEIDTMVEQVKLRALDL